MKKIISLLIAGITIITACQKRTVPVITSRTTDPPAPATTETKPADLAAGQVVYNNRCGRCHGLPETGKYTVKRWETIMASMAPRARLDKQQTVDVTAYVNANAKKE
jgi:mono/diheme cytochrome c family protein